MSDREALLQVFDSIPNLTIGTELGASGLIIEIKVCYSWRDYS